MYEERASRVEGAVLWQHRGARTRAVLPDGCMDLLWTPGGLFVAGPDTHAQAPGPVPGPRIAGVRFAPGTGPALLGVAAHEVRDQRIGLADIWGGAEARRLTERIDAAADPVAELERVALDRAVRAEPDPLLVEVVRRLDLG
ncbi:DUF6597 domain-containing transcriptional factor, partial [Streptomyces sp. NPDC055078]